MDFSIWYSKYPPVLAVHILLGLLIPFRVAPQATIKCLLGTSYELPSPSNEPQSIAFSPNGLYVATANCGSNDITLFNVGVKGVLSDGRSYVLPVNSTGPISVAFSPDGSYLATANTQSNDVSVFQTGNGGVLSGGISYALPSGSKAPLSVVFSPNGLYLAIANSLTDNISIFTVGAGGALSEGTSYALPLNCTYPYVAIFSPKDGLYLVTVNYGTITVFKVDSGILSGATSYSLDNLGQSAAFSPDGSYLAIVNHDEDITVFQVGVGGILSGGTEYGLPVNFGYPCSIAFSPNGLYLAVANCGSVDSNILVFGVEAAEALSGGTVYALPTESDAPFSVTFSPNNSYIATANKDSNDVTVFAIENSCNDNENHLDLILGITLGVGVPLLLAAIVVSSYFLYKKYGCSHAPHHPNPANIQSSKTPILGAYAAATAGTTTKR